MQPHQLEYFLAVAEAGSFTRGAQRAGVVQSAVSAAVAQLERQLGVRLLERGYHRVELTAEGTALVPHARKVLGAITAAREAVAAARGGLVGTVTLGTLAYSGRLDVSRLLESFQAAHPAVAVHLRQTIAGTSSSLDEVRSGLLDLALVSTPAAALPGVVLDDLHREPMVFVCAHSHPLARRAEVSIADLGEQTFIDSPTGWGNRTVVDLAFAAAARTREIRTEVTDFALARALVCRGLGVTIQPVGALDDSVARVPLREGLEWSIKLARPAARRMSAAATGLAERILE
jgi:DNA-binding transcriptional LysR family regulator